MLENPVDAPIKRYAPPNQRNRGLSRRKSSGWEAAVHCFNDPTVDLSERPVMYMGSPPLAWGNLSVPHQGNANLSLPHQLMASPRLDFLVELKRAIPNSVKDFKS